MILNLFLSPIEQDVEISTLLPVEVYPKGVNLMPTKAVVQILSLQKLDVLESCGLKNSDK